MASGPYPDPRRGTWTIQWWTGTKWQRSTVVRRRPGWKPGDAMPRKPPPEAMRALAEYGRREDAARLATPGGDMADATVAAFLGAYQADYPPGHAATSVRSLGYAVRSFLDFCKAIKVVKLRDVTADVCDRWAAEQARKGHGHAYIKTRRALLAAAWARAARKGGGVNPWAGVDVPVKRERKRRGSWTPDGFAALMAVSAPWLRDVLTLGCHTGLRINALRHLEWADVRWAGWDDGGGLGAVVVRPELDKAGVGYAVPQSATCHDLLMRRNRDRPADHDFVLAGAAGRPIGSESSTAKAITAACRRAGLPKPDSPNHHMRRTFGRWAVLGHLTGRPIPIYVVSKWMGHASVAMTEHYLQLDTTNSQQWMMPVTDQPAERDD